MRHKLVFAAPLVLVGALLHCSGTSNTVSDGSDAAVRNPVCPNTEPTAGGACGLAEGTTCNNYPSVRGAEGCYCCSGGGGGYTCSGGKWLAFATAGGGQPNTFVPCPDTVPKQGDSCGAPGCGGAQQNCNYDCAHGNGSVSSATCQNGTWEVRQSAVACEAADSGSDAADSGDAHDG